MRFLPSRANALFEFDEIASLAVAIEVFLPQRIARHAQGFEPVAQPFDETARSKSGRNPPRVCSLASFLRCPLLSRPSARARHGGTIPQSPAPIINDGRGQLATACVLG